MKTYASIAATIARKEGRHQTALTDAQKRGDRAGINAASRMLERIGQYKDELFADQEAQKVQNDPEQFAGGGNPPYALMSSQNPWITPQPFNGGINAPTLMGQNLQPQPIRQMSALAVNPTMPTIPGSAIPDMTGSGAGAGGGQSVDWGKVGQYAQFLPDVAGLININRMKAPANAPQLDPTIINTSVNTSAQTAAINSSNQRYNRGVENSVSSAPVAQALKLSGKIQGDQQMAQVLENKSNQERELANKQSELLTGNRNQNRLIDAENSNRQIDFSNNKINLQQGILNSMGVKGAGISQDNRRAALDQQSLSLYSKMFDPGLLARNGYAQDIPGLKPVLDEAFDKNPALQKQYEAYLKAGKGSTGAPRDKNSFLRELKLMQTQNNLFSGRTTRTH